MKKKAPPQMTASMPRISQSPRSICARIMCASWAHAGVAASAALRSNASRSIGFIALAVYGRGYKHANKCPLRGNKLGLLVPEKFVNAGFRPGALVDPLDDHR